MANGEEEVLLDLENFEETSAADIEAAPEFIEPPTGRYKLSTACKLEDYEREGDDGEQKQLKRYRIIYSIEEVIQLKDDKELVPANGSMFSETFTVTSEGLKYFKQRAQSILGDLGNATLGEVRKTLNGEVEPISFVADCHTKTSKQKDKETGEIREFTNVRVKVVTKNQAVGTV